MNPELATRPPTGLVDRGRQIIDRLPVSRTLIKFLIVGGVGFFINQFVLFLVYDTSVFWFLPDKGKDVSFALFTEPDIRLLIASIMAVEVAVICQFNFHERWTFRERNRTGFIFVRFLKYNAASAVSPFITVLCVNLLTPVFRDAAGEGSIIGKAAPYLANSIGVMLGFTWNYTLNTMIIWPHHRRQAAHTDD
jgi:putative flippase GtrA